jgi:hypothetical protein
MPVGCDNRPLGSSRLREAIMRTRLIAIAGLVLCAGTANAGNKLYVGGQSVAIGSDYFEGAYGQSRASSDSNELISCNLFAGPSSTYYYCLAIDAANNFKMCQLNGSSTMATALASITDFSWLFVRFDTSGNCTSIEVQNSSAYVPMTP